MKVLVNGEEVAPVKDDGKKAKFRPPPGTTKLLERSIATAQKRYIAKLMMESANG